MVVDRRDFNDAMYSVACSSGFCSSVLTSTGIGGGAPPRPPGPPGPVGAPPRPHATLPAMSTTLIHRKGFDMVTIVGRSNRGRVIRISRNLVNLAPECPEENMKLR